LFREQQDIYKWTAARWLQERGDSRARRMERLIMRKGGYTVSYYCLVLCAGEEEPGKREERGG